jgi:hypothetical protein
LCSNIFSISGRLDAVVVHQEFDHVRILHRLAVHVRREVGAALQNADEGEALVVVGRLEGREEVCRNPLGGLRHEGGVA